MSGGTRPPGARSQSVQDIVDGLASSGWGPLAGAGFRCARVLLQTLAKLSRSAHMDRRGVLTMTASQIAEQAGYSERWARSNLHLLEELGVIAWQRGGIVEGTPVPSCFRIVKTELRRIRRAAKATHDETERLRAEEFARRLRSIRLATLGPRRRWSDHAEAAATPTHYVRSGGRDATAPTPLHTTIENHPKGANAMPRRSQDPDPKFLPVRCVHGVGNPMGCHWCRFQAREAMKANEPPQAVTFPRSHRTPRPEPQPDALSVSAFDQYMDATYPDLTRAERARAALADPEAVRLARA